MIIEEWEMNTSPFEVPLKIIVVLMS